MTVVQEQSPVATVDAESLVDLDAELSFLFATTTATAESTPLVTARLTQVSPDVADARAVFLDSPFAGRDLVLPVNEFYPDRRWSVGDVHVVELITSGPRLLVSLVRPSLVELVVESISPEVARGDVRVMDVVRQPGVRAKVAVAATREGVDPVAAVVGHGARRVDFVRTTLGGERVDVVLFDHDPRQFLRNAFAPAEVLELRETDDPHALDVVVPRHQIAAAVGRGGLNATLAGRLCGFHVTVVPADH